jgi:lipoate-protein ligase A
MQLLTLTLETPEANLALDEALLDQAESIAESIAVLRLWEPKHFMVVLGRSSRMEREVDEKLCRARRIPIRRRCSGGAAILAGPGCLMYAVILSLESLPQLRAIPDAHAYVLERHAAAIRKLVPEVCRRGTSDLALADRKFSGNSLRAKRRHLLYHGTILYDFPLTCMDGILRNPPRQPAYRGGRDHRAFLVNVPATAHQLRELFVRCWGATESMPAWPRQQVDRLVAQRYGTDSWTRAM